MLQNLLAEREHMAYHKLKKEFPAYNLTVARGGPKLTPANGNWAGPALSVQASCDVDHVVVHNTDSPGIAQAISAVTKMRVIDQTGVLGRFDLNLDVGIDHDEHGLMHCGSQCRMLRG